MKKRLLSAILSFCMLLTMAPTVAFAADGDNGAANTNISLADATETSGTCGAEGSASSVTWKLTENNDSLYCVKKDDTTWRFYDNDKNGGDKVQAYTLTIAGEGAMADYGRNTTPWGLKLAQILGAEASKNNTVSDYCSPRITQIEFAADSNVTYIGEHAFRSTSISSISSAFRHTYAVLMLVCRRMFRSLSSISFFSLFSFLRLHEWIFPRASYTFSPASAARTSARRLPLVSAISFKDANSIFSLRTPKPSEILTTIVPSGVFRCSLCRASS